MSDTPIKCPECSQTGDKCTHSQEERRLMCQALGRPEEPEAQIYDSSNVEHINQKRTKSKRRATDEDNDLRGIMKTAQGRRFVARILEWTGMHRGSFTHGLPDAIGLAFREGQRDIGHRLYAELDRLCMPEYLLMLKERSSEDAAA